jgi:hypothetical protein
MDLQNCLQWKLATSYRSCQAGQVVFILLRSLAFGLRNRQWKHISTGSSLNTTNNENRVAVGVTEPLVEIRLSMVTVLREPRVEIRFY